MEYAKVKIIKPGITMDSADLEVGSEVNLTKRSAASLIKDGYAEALEAVLTDPDVKVPGAGAVGGTKQVVTDAAAAEKLVAKAIDAKFKAEQLKDAAKTLGVEFKFDDNKPTVIAAIIAQGKAEAILALEVPAV